MDSQTEAAQGEHSRISPTATPSPFCMFEKFQNIMLKSKNKKTWTLFHHVHCHFQAWPLLLTLFSGTKLLSQTARERGSKQGPTIINLRQTACGKNQAQGRPQLGHKSTHTSVGDDKVSVASQQLCKNIQLPRTTGHGQK